MSTVKTFDHMTFYTSQDNFYKNSFSSQISWYNCWVILIISESCVIYYVIFCFTFAAYTRTIIANILYDIDMIYQAVIIYILPTVLKMSAKIKKYEFIHAYTIYIIQYI